MELRIRALCLVMLAVVGLTACGPRRDGSTGSDQATPAAGQAGTNCTDTDPHPIGQSIAETYDVSYEQVMTWFCSGYSFDNIMIALETSQAVDVPAQNLLDMLVDKDWDAIWDEVGFTAKP